MSFSTIRGLLPAELANRVSDALHVAISKGMETDEAACVALGVIADYVRAEHGDRYLPALASVLLKRTGQPMPVGRSA